MKITYTPNPLNTIIELDEHEKKELWYKLKIEALVERLFRVHYELTYGSRENPKVDSILADVDPDYYLNDEDETGRSRLDKRIDEALAYYLDDLRSAHMGDCVCFACSCSKCHAEDLLGINTIKGLGKHPANKIDGAFSNGKNGDVWLPQASIHEAITRLENYDPKPVSSAAWDKVGGFDVHVPRWKEEAEAALVWLRNYRDEHSF